jgi:signal transduction histidine kinase
VVVRVMSSRSQIVPSGRTILVVDDQTETLTSVRLLLEREGHCVLTADSVLAALAVLEHQTVQLLLVDYYMPHMNGDELIRRVRARDPFVQILLQTGYAGEEAPRALLQRLDIQGYHDKSDGPERLLLWVDAALKAHDALVHLQAAERLKTELLASVSHEFRTPLNIIIGYVNLLHEGTFGPCPREAVDVLEKVRGNGGYLLELVEEFLDLSKLESGEMPVGQDEVAIGAILKQLAESFALLVRTRPVRFVADVPDELPAVVGEAAKLRVIVQNLLSNAIKFTREGSIRLAAASRADGKVVIRVSDTGPGIAPEHHEAIFDLFHQLQPNIGDRKGVGLGLALARRFARMLGGDITVESAVGAGTTFTVVLPASIATPLSAEAAA